MALWTYSETCLMIVYVIVDIKFFTMFTVT